MITPRELECLAHLSTGKTAKEIGRTINIGTRTVETYLNSTRQKTSCYTRSELIQWFENTFQHFLIHSKK